MRTAGAMLFPVMILAAGCQHARHVADEVDSPDKAIAAVSEQTVCLKDLAARVRDRGRVWCVSYEPKVEPGQYVIGPEGIVCVEKRTGAVVDTMIFHASPPACP